MDPTGESSSLVAHSGAHYDAVPRSSRHNSLGPSPNECAAIEEILSATEQRRRRETRVLLGALFFCFIFMIVELAFGILAHSLALLTDASHLLIDVGSYTLSIMSLRAAARGACRKYSYGWHRAEVIGTLVSVFSIWALVVWISIEALTRAWNIIACSRVSIALLQDAVKLSKGDAEVHGECKEINSAVMILVGIIGMVVNIVCAGILYYGGSHGHSHFGGAHGHGGGGHHDHDHSHSHEHSRHEEQDEDPHDHHDHHDHDHDHDHCHSHGENEKGQKKSKGVAVHAALLHALGDCVQSVGVILAGVFIFVSNRLVFKVSSYRYSIYNLADPVCSLIFAVITLYMTKSLIGDLLGILMESTPPGIDYDALKNSLLSINGVMSMHDLHVWSLSSDYLALSVHIVADDAEQTLRKAQYVCETLFGIDHTTIQVDTVENGSDRCQAVCA